MPMNSQFPQSEKWDDTTKKVVETIRSHLHREPQPNLSTIQKESRKSRRSKGPFLHCKATIPVPAEDDIRQLFLQVVDEIEKIDYQPPNYAPVDVEWTSFTGTGKGTSESNFNTAEAEVEKYEKLAKASVTDLVILHVHGGAYCQGSPETSRSTTTRLAKLTRGRVCSVDVRLAPQNMFPSAEIDAILAYLSLLYPPNSSFHTPIPPDKIVFTGDSSGASELYAVLCFILHIHRKNGPLRTYKFNGKDVTIPLPAGIATIGMSGDQISSLPSYKNNSKHDIFVGIPWEWPDYPSCDLWPAKPPRISVYYENLSTCHPLISATLISDWTGAPPMWFGMGEELAIDSARVMAQRASAQGVTVVWKEFEAMPHGFLSLPVLSSMKQSEICFQSWADFCIECVQRPKLIESSASIVRFKGAKEEEKNLYQHGDLSFDQAEQLMRTSMIKKDKWFQTMLTRKSKM
ncbi:lipase/esterase [Sclerotinia borealis F-4128]|uniref:Lipase/esterase n=1 Tax=Sclerotinia borealis (strain F-4128) TaxID=1432307 RepID=W9CLC4_SCLBF|nr:lipase/esterase [Sclerotinia borealis F-4128]